MAAQRTDKLEVRTPEGIAFSLALAGPPARFLAWCIDVACLMALYTLLTFIVVAAITPVATFLGKVGADIVGALYMVGLFILRIGYNIAFEWLWRGQTPGKWMLRLRVMDEQGLQLHFSQIVIRNILRAVDALPVLYLVGGAACLISRRAQRLGDFAANTIVVRTPRPAEPDLAPLDTDKYNSFRDYPHLEARLRQRVSPEQAAVAAQAVARRESLEPDARVQLFEEVANHFRAIVAFPDEATYGLTDEQYVRNVLDSVYRTTKK
jgi:uncharacterized RDD family membrane protein YckC